ncbi:hypothetical protein HMPREF9700_01797 [Bergeyella zoohelcum CCUG 30536]|uniref:Por secretion system C-terminal sorting domain n=2 Tax=Bergeyella zoohelcum TaxID=1015 RepID=A0A380ZWU3_9FLAO|nr:hypothetical protein HMPREF9700_01797 [Bergeyella zoohelcum CCUG 30536]SUV53199.1 Por secretion system C-terminal sorting domain [Bergeyella zoohelcum]
MKMMVYFIFYCRRFLRLIFSERIIFRCSLLLFGIMSSSLWGQKSAFSFQYWYFPSSSESKEDCQQGVLNFHCKSHFNFYNFPFSERKNQLLVVVNKQGGKDKRIWSKGFDGVILEEDVYQTSEKSHPTKLKKQTSIFSYRSLGRRFSKDSSSIRIEHSEVYELIYDEKFHSNKKLEQIHTYLALKYGISLKGHSYIDSNGKVLWDGNQEKEFSHSPTGIGRDDTYGLYQKQSQNADDSFLTISKGELKTLNVQNKSELLNQSFAIWADNGKSFEKEIYQGFEILEKQWKINFMNGISHQNYYIRIEKEKLNSKSDSKSYWLFIQKQDGEYYSVQGVENGRFVDFLSVDFPREAYAIFTFGMKSVENRNEELIPEKVMPVSQVEDILHPEMILYPNPVKKNEVFTIKLPQKQDFVVRIFDQSGKLLLTGKGENTAEFSHRMMIAGMYMVVIQMNGGIEKSFKLIIHDK